jgi:hypothetical protein
MIIVMRGVGILWMVAVALGITVYMSLLEHGSAVNKPSIATWFFALALLVVGCIPAWCLLGTQPLIGRRKKRKRKPRPKTW